MTSKDYEIFVKNFFTKLNEESGITHSKCFHNKRYKGKSTRTWDVDVSYNFTVNQLNFKVFIECKYWNQSVDVGKISLLKQCLDDCDAHKGVVVTTVGFQEGAIKAAKKLGMGLLILKDYDEPEFLHHFDGGNVFFNDSNTNDYIYTNEENTKFLSGFIEPKISFIDYAKGKLDADILEMFINKDFSPIWNFENERLRALPEIVLKVISDYDKIIKCGLPFEISDNSYSKNLLEIYMIKANNELDS